MMGVDKQGFSSLWKRVKPVDKPDEGVPFDPADPMLQPLPNVGRRSVHEEEGEMMGVVVGVPTTTTPSPPPPPPSVPPTHLSQPQPQGAPPPPPPPVVIQGPVQDPPPRKSSKNALNQIPTIPNGGSEKIIPQDEDMKRLLQECRYGMGNASLLGGALVHAKPEDLKKDPIIKVRFFFLLLLLLPL